MSEELPEGWASARLRDGVVAGAQTGFACGKHSRDARGVAHLRPMNVSEAGRLRLDDVKFIDIAEVDRDERWIRSGDVLFNNTNSPELVGKTAVYTDDAPRAFSNHMTRLRCSAAAEPQFLAHAIHQKWREGLFASICNNHVSQASINTDVLLDLELLLPPLAEQGRIVTKVEALLDQVRRAKDRLDRVPLILKRFRRSVLAAACSGNLTSGWREANPHGESAEQLVKSIFAARSQTQQAKHSRAREAPLIENLESPVGWCTTRIGDLVDCLDHVRKPINRDDRAGRTGSVPYYGANGPVGWIDSHLFDEDLVLVVEDETFIGRDKPFSYVIRGKAWVNNHAHVLRALGGMSADYLHACLSYYDFVPLTSGTTGRRKLTKGALMEAPLAIAPLREQAEIVRLVDGLFALATSIEQRVERAAARADSLPQAILSKAFAGELVPTEADLARAEGRDYETAEQLLERVAAEAASVVPIRPAGRSRSNREPSRQKRPGR